MEGEDSQMANMQGQMVVPMGRGLLPEELAENKQKGRDLSRLVRKGKKNNLSIQEVEERREKNRVRQRRFREKQKSREAAEEEARNAGAQYQAAAMQSMNPHMAHDVHPHHVAYPSENEIAYDVSQQDTPTPISRIEAQMQMMKERSESLAEKRKRQGRERQARFRDRKRARSVAGRGPHPHLEDEDGGSEAKYDQAHPDGLTLAELQKLSAQLSGYYIGLTQNLSHEEHQAVMRFFLEGLREDLGDELVGGVASYMFADAQAQVAAAAQAQYLHHGMSQGLELQNLHALQAALAAAHMAPQDVQAHLQSAQMGTEQQVGSETLQAQLDQMNVHPATTQADGMQGAQIEYHRGLSEQQNSETLEKAGNSEANAEPQQQLQIPGDARQNAHGLAEVPVEAYQAEGNDGQYSELQATRVGGESQARGEPVEGLRSQALRSQSIQGVPKHDPVATNAQSERLGQKSGEIVYENDDANRSEYAPVSGS